MPVCKTCGSEFSGAYREHYCGDVCRLMGRVDKRECGCWEWIGKSRSTAGYGVINIKGRLVSAHRLSYSLFVGAIDDGLFVCHRCDNPSCVNPDHLFVGTNADNAGDMAAKGRAAWKNKSIPVEVRAKISATRKKSGWKPSSEQIASSVAARAEKLRDPAWKASVYDKMRGENNPNYGKPMGDEQRANLEESYWSKMRGKPRGPMSDETKKRISEAHQRRKK